jgi:hypothetical protein
MDGFRRFSAVAAMFALVMLGVSGFGDAVYGFIGVYNTVIVGVLAGGVGIWAWRRRPASSTDLVPRRDDQSDSEVGR